MPIRQPIISILGHVDSGKTTILDQIRGSAVAAGESGGITQHIGASEIPVENIESHCGNLLERMKVDLKIPGLLFVDTPGHEAFTTLRKRGGAVSDLGVLVIDINEGFQPQTEESLMFLKEFKTPFVVAATKIDRILGWHSEKCCFIDKFSSQDKRAQDELTEKIYRIVGQLAEKGFKSERYDRVEDFSKEVGIIPICSTTGEGIPDLLVILAGLAQKYLEERLEITSEQGKGTVLEVKVFKGLGTTLDVILYDGTIRKGDTMIIGGKEIVETKVKSILKPEPMKEMRVERRFKPVNEVSAAAGIKVSANEIENVISGSPLRFLKESKDIVLAKQDIEKEIEEVEIETQNKGLILKADTLGSLEALIKTLKDLEIPIRKAKVGNVLKADVIEASGMEKPVIIAFNVDVLPDAQDFVIKENVKIFQSDVIYKILEDYQEWIEETKKAKEKELLESAIRPCKIKILPGFVFRQSKPAVFGVEVLAGTIKSGYKLRNKDRVVGVVREMQKEGENVSEGRTGDRLALSMDGVTIGRQINEGETLMSSLRNRDFEILNKLKSKLPADERKLLEEFENE